MNSYYSLSRVRFPYAWLATGSDESGEEWIAGELDLPGAEFQHAERWALFMSGQFIHHRGFDEVQHFEGRSHVLETLDTVTAALELAAEMACRNILSSETAITFELFGVDGLKLTWPEDVLDDALGRNRCCQDENVSIDRLISTGELRSRNRELALEIALSIYSRFGWSDAPRERLADTQARRYGT